MNVQPVSQHRRRVLSFFIVGIGLVAAYGALRGVTWRGDVWIPESNHAIGCIPN